MARAKNAGLKVAKPIKLKCEKETIISVEYDDLEDYVEKVYPFLKGYQFAVVQECGNDTQHRFVIDGKIDKQDAEDWEKIKVNKVLKNYRNRLLLDMLCHDGLIEPGTYLIAVCW